MASDDLGCFSSVGISTLTKNYEPTPKTFKTKKVRRRRMPKLHPQGEGGSCFNCRQTSSPIWRRIASGEFLWYE